MPFEREPRGSQQSGFRVGLAIEALAHMAAHHAPATISPYQQGAGQLLRLPVQVELHSHALVVLLKAMNASAPQHPHARVAQRQPLGYPHQFVLRALQPIRVARVIGQQTQIEHGGFARFVQAHLPSGRLQPRSQQGRGQPEALQQVEGGRMKSGGA